MQIHRNPALEQWESFLKNQNWSPFLQSFPMGEVYRTIGEEPVRLMVKEGNEIVILCQAVEVLAKRGRHLAVMYGPLLGEALCTKPQALTVIVDELKRIAKEKNCVFIRMSPFWRNDDPNVETLRSLGFRPSPLHLLAEHIWYLNLQGKTEEQILMGMRKTTRNLVRRAEKEGVIVTVSKNPVQDLPIFLALYEETRKRHHFVPYQNEFIRAQVAEFSPLRSSSYGGQAGCILYIARYKGEPVAASVHIVYGGETSYHHGASSNSHPECYASYLLQWTAIRDALQRGDRIYNFWGVSPEGAKKHPFAGVRTFKTGFGGELLELMHCMDLPLSPKYFLTFGFETLRKWKRGF